MAMTDRERRLTCSLGRIRSSCAGESFRKAGPSIARPLRQQRRGVVEEEREGERGRWVKAYPSQCVLVNAVGITSRRGCRTRSRWLWRCRRCPLISR